MQAEQQGLWSHLRLQPGQRGTTRLQITGLGVDQHVSEGGAMVLWVKNKSVQVGLQVVCTR